MTFAEMLADHHHDTATTFHEYVKYPRVGGLLVDTKQAEYDTKSEIRSHFLAAHNTWCKTIKYYQAKTQQFRTCVDSYLCARDELYGVLFWIATFLFGSSFTYFLWRIFACKCDWITIPADNTWYK